MANTRDGLSSDFNGIRQAGPAQDSKLAKLDYQELLDNRVLSSGGVRHPITHASLFDRDDSMRVASDAESFELSTEEVVAIQDAILASTLPAGQPKSSIKVQGKSYSVKSADDDTLVAEGEGGNTIVASLTASLVLVILTSSDQVDAIRTIARSFSEGLSNQAV